MHEHKTLSNNHQLMTEKCLFLVNLISTHVSTTEWILDECSLNKCLKEFTTSRVSNRKEMNGIQEDLQTKKNSRKRMTKAHFDYYRIPFKLNAVVFHI